MILDGPPHDFRKWTAFRMGGGRNETKMSPVCLLKTQCFHAAGGLLPRNNIHFTHIILESLKPGCLVVSTNLLHFSHPQYRQTKVFKHPLLKSHRHSTRCGSHTIPALPQSLHYEGRLKPVCSPVFCQYVTTSKSTNNLWFKWINWAYIYATLSTYCQC